MFVRQHEGDGDDDGDDETNISRFENVSHYRRMDGLTKKIQED